MNLQEVVTCLHTADLRTEASDRVEAHRTGKFSSPHGNKSVLFCSKAIPLPCLKHIQVVPSGKIEAFRKKKIKEEEKIKISGAWTSVTISG